ncbi:MAG: clostripain-related cysteine peptidase [Spirochaetaceae bacterium]
MKKILIFLFSVIFLISCEIQPEYPTADWTLMFYIGDDSTSPLTLVSDVLELTESQVNTSDIRLVILYDGAVDGDSQLEILDSPLSSTSRIIDLDDTTIINTNNELDMADPETLKSYIKYTKRMLPADNYALYFGSHGTGFTSTYSSGLIFEGDGTSPETIMTIEEISDTLYDVDGVQLVAFDACSVGNIETIYEFNGSAEYVIASPEEIPVPGNDYIGFIEAAYSLTELSTLNLGKATLECYYNYYDINETSFYGHEARSLQQLYNVEEISVIVESLEFKNDTLDFLTNKTVSATEFNGGNYTDLFDISSLNTDFEQSITTAENGIYTWLSIYMPDSGNYNAEYELTKFAIENPGWVGIID